MANGQTNTAKGQMSSTSELMSIKSIISGWMSTTNLKSFSQSLEDFHRVLK